MAWLSRRLGVARSGYYAWKHRQQAPPGKRQADNAVITADIQAVFHEHRGCYGSPGSTRNCVRRADLSVAIALLA